MSEEISREEIAALLASGSENPNKCEDAISRQAAENITWDEPSYTDALNVLTEVRDKIRALPYVTPKQRTGKWIEKPEIKTSAPEYLMFYECSECGDEQCFCKLDIHKKHFCSNCGAKMVEPQESEEQA